MASMKTRKEDDTYILGKLLTYRDGYDCTTVSAPAINEVSMFLHRHTSPGRLTPESTCGNVLDSLCVMSRIVTPHLAHCFRNHREACSALLLRPSQYMVNLKLSN